MASNLNEGMRPGDLEDLILPLITVDEYESKLDDAAIVIGFYINDKDAAEDLNRFIQKSAVELLDTEVSPAPDQHGYYIVFIEMMNDRRLAENIKNILEEVSPLAEVASWQMRVRGLEEVVPFSDKVLAKRFAELRADLDQKEDGDDEDRVMEFLTPSALESAVMEGSEIVLHGMDGTLYAEVVGLGDLNKLLTNHSLTESAVSLSMNDIAEALQIARLLGEGWLSNKVGEHSLLQHIESTEALLLKNARFA